MLRYKKYEREKEIQLFLQDFKKIRPKYIRKDKRI